MNKIKVVIKNVGEKPYVTHISDTLQNLQSLVGGYIETVTVSSDTVIICNEEGRLIPLEPNCRICGIEFFGTVIFAGISGDEFADIPIEFKDFKKLFKSLWRETR